MYISVHQIYKIFMKGNDCIHDGDNENIWRMDERFLFKTGKNSLCVGKILLRSVYDFAVSQTKLKTFSLAR